MAKKNKQQETTKKTIELDEETLKKIDETKKKAKKGIKNIWHDFKTFISRGNVIDMSIGVVIGGAFGAIVTAFTNIILSVCTWAVPGGLKGLVTVLPAAGASQAGMANIGQCFQSTNLEAVVRALFNQGQGGYATLDSARSAVLSNYTLHGSNYIYNGASIIDWGAVINAAISFFIIALVLFAIIKSVSAVHKARLAAQAKALEEYYKKHPSARPVVEVKVPELNERQLLKEILITLKEQNAQKAQKTQVVVNNTTKKK